MGIVSNKIDRENLKVGDHVYSWRKAYIYAQHGIYVGAGKLIHFTPGTGQEVGTGTSFDRFTTSSLPSPSLDNPCPRCGSDQATPLLGVLCSCIDCFLMGGDPYLFEYSVSTAYFLAQPRGGTCTMAKSDPESDVLHRAIYLLKNGFGAYNIFRRNCEDFAIYCKTGLLIINNIGLGTSGQAAAAMAATSTLISWRLRLSLAAAGSVSAVGTAAAVVGNYCINRYNSDIGVRRDAIKIPVEMLLTIYAGLQNQELEEEQRNEENSEVIEDEDNNDRDNLVLEEGRRNEANGEEIEDEDDNDRDNLVLEEEQRNEDNGEEIEDEDNNNSNNLELEKEEKVKRDEEKKKEIKDGGKNDNDNPELEKGKGKEIGNENKNNGSFQYPQRPDQRDCLFYLRTGTCKFGLNCKFNHPARKKNQYYLRNGECMFGKACKYKHPTEINFMGLPILPGTKECPFYMRNGSCKHGTNCWFNHPEPTTLRGSDSFTGLDDGSVSLQRLGTSLPSAPPWPSARTFSEAVSYSDASPPPVQVVHSPPQVVNQNTDSNGYQAFNMAEEAKAKGNAAFSTGQFHEAIRFFSEAIDLFPINHILYSNRSAAYASIHKYSEALSDAKKTVEINPDCPKGYSRLGVAHVGLGSIDEAIAAYKKGLQLDPNNEALKSGLAYAATRSRDPPIGNIFQDAKKGT